jgi:hypothetical protein
VAGVGFVREAPSSHVARSFLLVSPSKTAEVQDVIPVPYAEAAQQHARQEAPSAIGQGPDGPEASTGR